MQKEILCFFCLYASPGLGKALVGTKQSLGVLGDAAVTRPFWMVEVKQQALKLPLAWHVQHELLLTGQPLSAPEVG